MALWITHPEYVTVWTIRLRCRLISIYFVD